MQKLENKEISEGWVYNRFQGTAALQKSKKFLR